jgi:hypothetical protein
MSATFVQRQLEAGGFVPLAAKCDLAATEAIVVRTYASPVLGNRVVVKLSSERLVAAEDLAMEYLGLQAQGVSPPLGRQHRSALDFAHWALIHQPDKARYALDLVKRMKSAERKAAAKPGHAWDMYAAMADELNKSVRHFLPAFWEQAARSFKVMGNLTYAGRALNKALEAERVHALKVDREHRRDAVLEFSLGGCLSGKALSDYSKDLAAQFEPREAYDTYRDLLIRRTSGGMPPTANAGTDLIRLAKAAKLDVDSEIESFLERIIVSPAMVRAPMQFWKSVQKQVGSIVKRNDAFAVWLLVHTNPQPRYSDDSVVWSWIDLLDAWNALPLLWRPASELPSHVTIPGGRAGWISRLATVEQSPNKWVFELLEKMGAVLRQEGNPVDLKPARKWHHWVDVDILEACLQLGIPVSDSVTQCDLEFSGWLRESIDHPRRNSQCQSIAADPRFARLLAQGMAKLVVFHGDSTQTRPSYGRKMAPRRAFDAAAMDHPFVIQFWWDYLDQNLRRLEEGGIYQLESGLAALSKCLGVKAITQFPDITKRLAAVNIVDNLEKTFKAGVLDEYGWLALDEHVTSYPLPTSKRHYQRAYDLAFPWVSYQSQGEAHVVGPCEARTPVPVVLQKGDELEHLYQIGNDVIAIFRSPEYERFWRWLSERVETRRKFEFYFGYHSVFQMVPLPDGAWFVGGGSVHPGDKTLPVFQGHWYSDGRRLWKPDNPNGKMWYLRSAEDEERAKCYEIDANSGKQLRESVPPFFEADLPAGSRLRWFSSYYLPCPKLANNSPLGEKDGMIGWRVVTRRDGSVTGTGIDGRSATISAERQPRSHVLAPIALIDKPALNGRYWLMSSDSEVIDQDSGTVICNLSDESTKYYAGQPLKLDPLFFHFFQVRHLASSQRLRQVTRKTTETIFALAKMELASKKLDPDSPLGKKRIGYDGVRVWLADAPERLLTGVAKIVEVAVTEQVLLEKLVNRCRDQADSLANQESQKQTTYSHERANAGLFQLELQNIIASPLPARVAEQFDNVDHILSAARFLGGEACDELPPTALNWFALLKDLAAVAYRCFWRTATNETYGTTIPQRVRTPWLDALRMLASSGLLNIKNKLTMYIQTLESSFRNPAGSQKKNGWEGRIEANKPIAFIEGSSRYIAYRYSGYQEDLLAVLECATNDKPKPPKGMQVEQTVPLPKTWSVAFLEAFLTSVEKLETLPLPAIEDLESAGAEIGMHPIAVALTFMSDLRTTKYGQEKLTKELRDFYDWKVKDIQFAISQLEADPPPDAVGCEFARSNPSDALGSKLKLAVSRMVMAWKTARERVVSIPPEIATILEKANKSYRAISVSKFTEMLSNPKTADYLKPRRVTIELSKRRNTWDVWNVIAAEYEPSWGVDAAYFFFHLARSIGVVNYSLPVGHELRRQIPALIRAARELADHPDTQLPFGGSFSQFDDYNQVKTELAIANYAALIGPLQKDETGVYRGDDGLVTMGLVAPKVVCLFRASKLLDASDLAKVTAVAAVTYEYQLSCEHLVQAATSLLSIRGAAFDRLISQNEHPAIAVGAWDQNALLSVPDIVTQAAGQFGIRKESASLYLQVLALPDPTQKNLCTWNSWSTKQLAEYAQELIAKELVVQAKRSRSSRDIFLPGGWEALAAPNLPIESWKLPMYGYQNTEALRGGGAEMIVWQETVDELFQRAWQRVCTGDAPRYEEVEPKRTGKK